MPWAPIWASSGNDDYSTICMHAGVGKPFFEFGTEPPACQLQCWSLEPYLKQCCCRSVSCQGRAPGEVATPFTCAAGPVRES